MSHLIRNVSVVGAPPTDLLIRDGMVTAVGDIASAPGDVTVIDGTGLVALPGLVDLHTHLREPGREDAETVLTGSQAAALGGYTAVCAMANTSPVADSVAVVERVYRLGRTAGLVDVQPIGAVTVGLGGESLAEIGPMAASAVRVRIFSDDGHCVSDPRLMREALRRVAEFDGVVAQHAEDPRLTAGAQMNEGSFASRLGMTGWPGVAEETIIARDALLAEDTGARLHVCHVSTARSVEVIRWAKARGVRITAEVTPHHLLLTDERAATGDPIFKVNPPLRTAEDVAALRRGLIEGVIDVVATDHAPHTDEDKQCGWEYARPGMLGLQTALSIVVAACMGPDGLDWSGVAERMSRVPARIAGLAEHGHDPAAGTPANLTLVDPGSRWRVLPAELASKSGNTPYAGMELPVRVVATFFRGTPTVLDGKLTAEQGATA